MPVKMLKKSRIGNVRRSDIICVRNKKQEENRKTPGVKRTPPFSLGRKRHTWSVESNQNHCGGPIGAGYPEAGAVAAAELEGREPTGPCVDDNDDADKLPLLALTISTEIEADRLALVW
jgi:hypothetical protein